MHSKTLLPSINAFFSFPLLLSEILCTEDPHPHLLVTFERVSESDGALKYKQVSSEQSPSLTWFPGSSGAGEDNLKYENILRQNKLTYPGLGPGPAPPRGIHIDTGEIEQSDGNTRDTQNLVPLQTSEQFIKNVANRRNSFEGSNDNEVGTSAAKFPLSDLTFSSFALLAISIIAFILYL